MRRVTPVVFIVALMCVEGSASAQTPAAAPAWADPVTWGNVHPTETHNIVYANMPVIKNPSVLNPSRPGGVVLPVPNIGGTVDLHLDVFQMPSAKPAPVVVHLHGGGWTAPAGQSHSFAPFTALLAAGISVVSVQYRSSLEAPAPAALQDVHCALSWVKANAAKYNFDVNRVILYGVSAGGESCRVYFSAIVVNRPPMLWSGQPPQSPATKRLPCDTWSCV